ncbi:MAG: fibronectin type III domain-containing protein [Candidatus Uhrbacteria bacterium]
MSEGETVVIGFSSAFDTSAVVEDDVDVQDDGADLTTAANCGGAEQASVAMASDALTITICPGDGGAIAAASEITVKIGTNATASGIGANQVANPATAGTYYLSIAGTFGDSGSIALPMLETGSVGVTGTVPASGGSGGGGGGGGGGCGDSTAPGISSVIVSSITASAATISWTTDENADSAVDYGTTTSYLSGTESDTSLVTSHSKALSGLSEGTAYHVRIRSKDLCSNEASSSDQTFSTTDASAPVISYVVATVTSSSSATITWTTDEPATSYVNYGTTVSYGIVVGDSTLTTSHSVIVTGLDAGTTYHFDVVSTDASSNSSASSDATFVTSSNPAPTNVSNLSVASGDGSLTISWTNPSDADFAGVRVLLCASGYPSGPDDSSCTVVYTGIANSTTVTSLTNGTTYYVGVFAYDTVGQFASGALGSGTPNAPVEEVPTPVEVPEPVVTPPEGEPTVPVEPVATAPTAEPAAPSEEIPAGTETPAEPALPIPPTTVAAGELVPQGDVSFFVAGGLIQLEPSGSGTVRLLGNRPLQIVLQTQHIVKPVSRVQLVLGASAYIMAMAQDGSTYAADVASPGTPADYGTAVSISYTDGTVQSITFTLEVIGDGYAYSQRDGHISRVGGANVTLLENGTVSWDGSPFRQFNPITTADDGLFGWYVPNTTYALSADASGYLHAETGTFSVTDHIANQAIRMELHDAEVAPPTSLTGAVTSNLSVAGNIVSASLEAVRSVPGVEQAAAASTPALAAITAVSAAVLFTSFDLLPFLQYLFTSPFLFFWRRKRQAFGVVYNAVTKVPLDLATVRLFRMPDDWNGETGVVGRLVQSRVTDKGGRYFFLPPPGRYRIAALKSQFVFPSAYLRGLKDDGSFLDVYHGEPILVTDANASVSANIPLDPAQAAEHRTPKQIVRRARLRMLQRVVAVLGVLLAIVVAIIRPTAFSIGMVGVQIAFHFLVRRLAVPRKPKSWGIVYDQATGRPLEHVIARVFEPKYNKLLETAVTDSKGRYTFLLGPNEYYTVYEKPGFEKAEIRPIDYRSLTEPSEFSRDVKLSHEKTV